MHTREVIVLTLPSKLSLWDLPWPVLWLTSAVTDSPSVAETHCSSGFVYEGMSQFVGKTLTTGSEAKHSSSPNTLISSWLLVFMPFSSDVLIRVESESV